MTRPTAASPTIDSLRATAVPLWRRPWLWGLLAIAAVLMVLLLRQVGAAAPAARYLTETVQRGDLEVTVQANGTLAATRTVNVGSELSGTVARVLVDVNDRVRRGQVLIELDTALLKDQLERSRATLASAEAKLVQSTATVAEARRSLSRMEDVARRSGGKVPSATEFDTAYANVLRAAGEEAGSQASVGNARAALRSDETNLRKASIRSAIDGVVLTRSVEPGVTVAASLQAVTLLVLAEDLRRMKLQVNVDEADVARVQSGQEARFTVSAWPNRTYPARIERVGFGPTTKENVVTYVADLVVDNNDLSLRPGMTATAVIAATTRKDVLLVPNAALRFNPSDTLEAAPTGLVGRLLPRPPGVGATRRQVVKDSQARVWVLRDGEPMAVPVEAGLSNGQRTEVTGALHPGDAVITEQLAVAR